MFYIMTNEKEYFLVHCPCLFFWSLKCEFTEVGDPGSTAIEKVGIVMDPSDTTVILSFPLSLPPVAFVRRKMGVGSLTKKTAM